MPAASPGLDTPALAALLQPRIHAQRQDMPETQRVLAEALAHLPAEAQAAVYFTCHSFHHITGWGAGGSSFEGRIALETMPLASLSGPARREAEAMGITDRTMLFHMGCHEMLHFALAGTVLLFAAYPERFGDHLPVLNEAREAANTLELCYAIGLPLEMEHALQKLRDTLHGAEGASLAALRTILDANSPYYAEHYTAPHGERSVTLEIFCNVMAYLYAHGTPREAAEFRHSAENFVRETARLVNQSLPSPSALPGRIGCLSISPGSLAWITPETHTLQCALTDTPLALLRSMHEAGLLAERLRVDYTLTGLPPTSAAHRVEDALARACEAGDFTGLSYTWLKNGVTFYFQDTSLAEALAAVETLKTPLSCPPAPFRA